MGDEIVRVAIGVAVANLIAGGLVLFGWYQVQKRFLSHEYPGDLQRITSQINHLETTMRADIGSVRNDIAGLRGELASAGIKLVEHTVTLGEHQRRIGKVEDKLDMRRADLDETHGNQTRRR